MYKRILIPVDGSAVSDRALAAGLALARESGGRVRLFHLIDAGSGFNGFDPYGTFTADLLGVLREGGMKVLTQAMGVAHTAGVQATYDLCDDTRSRLGDAVANAAMMWNADLIVTGSHGRRGTSRALLGSGAEDIARSAPVPTLIVRDAQQQPSPPGGQGVLSQASPTLIA